MSAATEGEEETVTMSDLLDRERALEEEAEAKLAENWGDENACTFEQGYITQPVYSCSTCTKDEKEPFGFCFGCSMNCHVDHDVIELFDKRHFKCDCGTPKSGCTCKFSDAQRLQNNSENKYTQNFQGKYCWCSQAYDPDVGILYCEFRVINLLTKRDIMSQCVICEDWFHQTCISRRAPPPDLSTYKGFVCHQCIERQPFFLRYPQLQPALQNTTTSNNNNNTEPNTTTTTTSATTTTTPTETPADVKAKPEKSDGEKSEVKSGVKNEDKKDSSTSTDTTDTKTEKKDDGTENKPGSIPCILQQHPAPPTPASFPDVFLIPGWRTGLCRCADCTAMYHASNVEFLLDAADDPDEEDLDQSTTNDEASAQIEDAAVGGKRKREYLGVSMLEQAEKAFLEDTPHNNKLNAISRFSDMKAELKDYLRSFAESGKVVKESDITEFFQELNKKHQRT